MNKINLEKNIHFLLKINFYSYSFILLFFSLNVVALDTSSLKKSAPIYQNPFDLASGGASMTRATQEGVLFSNPSLPAFGEGVFRWIFLRSTVSIGSDTISIGQDAVKAASNFNSSQVQNLMNDIVKKPIHLGLDNAGGVITSNFGIAGFAVGKVDMEGQEFGSMGLPQIKVRNNAFAGVASSFSTKIGDTLALGVGPKYIYNTEMNTDLGVNEILDVEQAKDKIINSIKKGSAISTDVGFTLQKRSKHFDIRLAGVVSDIGNTAFTGGVPPWLQTYNAGIGFAIHNDKNALHCSFDYRDITDVYGEDFPKKMYMGCKLLLTRYVGFGFGYLQGWPSYGVVLNLFLFRVEAGSYTKDAGYQQAGLVGRQVYFVSLGFEI